MNSNNKQGNKYWYMQKDVECFLHSFQNKLWTL